MSGSIESRNWWSTNSFSGRPSRRTRRDSHDDVRFTSAARTRADHGGGHLVRPHPPLGVEGEPDPRLPQRPGPALGDDRERRAPGLDVQQEQCAVAVGGPDVLPDQVARDVVAEVVVGSGRPVGDGDDQLVDRLDVLARLAERPGRAHQPPLHGRRGRWRRARPWRRSGRCRSRRPGTGGRRRSGSHHRAAAACAGWPAPRARRTTVGRPSRPARLPARRRVSVAGRSTHGRGRESVDASRRGPRSQPGRRRRGVRGCRPEGRAPRSRPGRATAVSAGVRRTAGLITPL